MSSTNWLGGSGSWTTASAWSSGVPTSAGEALFATGSTAPYTVSGAGAPGSIAVTGDQVDLTGTVSTTGAAAIPYGPLDVTVSGGGGLTITGTLADGGGIIGAATPGAVSVSGSSAVWRGGVITIGSATAAGTLDIGNGALAFDYAGGLDDGTVSVSGAGSAWENFDFLVDFPNGAPTNLFVTNQGTLIGGGIFAAQATLSIDDTAVLTGGLLMARTGAVIQAINPAGQTSSTPVVLGLPLQLPTYSYMPAQAGQYASAPGTALVLTGTILPARGFSVLETGPGTVFLTSTSNMTRSVTDIDGGTLVLAGPGAAGGAPVQFIGGGVLVIGTAGSPGVVTADGDAAADTVFAGSAANVGGGTGQLTFINGNGASSVVGNNAGGALTVFGGVGGGLFRAAVPTAPDILVAGAGAATLQGAASGDQLYANGTAADVLIAGAGAETLSGSGAAGNNTYSGSNGSDLIVAGAGADTVVAGTGTQTIFGGSGSTTIQETGGRDLIVGGSGADEILPGAGYATVFGGLGADLYDFVAGQVGGTELIYNFRPGTDLIHLAGYAAGAAAATLQNAVVAGGSTTLTLPDSTRITLVGITNPTSNIFG